MLSLTSCDDTTDTLGIDMMPTVDFLNQQGTTYDVVTESYEVGDAVLSRSNMYYLGRFTDPETGAIVKSDFLAQYYCTEGFAFPDSVKDYQVTSVDIRLYIADYVGDSLANFKLSVYPLTKDLDPEADYYTNIDPTLYYNEQAEPIATKWFSISDRTIPDSVRWSSDYEKSIRISMPQEVGQAIYDEYKKNPKTFSNTESWVKSGLVGSKGFYFKLEGGDGAMAYIDVSQFNIHFTYYDETYAKDTIGVVQFASTEEVIQATRIENSGLEELMANKDVTYLKSPAGIFTLATLPTSQISATDTINSASITFHRYNDLTSSTFKLGIPKYLLMVRLDDYLNGFFEKYQLADNVTSYLAEFQSNTNTYEFSNIAKLLSTILNEKKQGRATANADKVLLIPVEPTYVTYSGSKVLVKLVHDFSLTSTKLVGGANDRVKLNIIYSSYKK